MGQPEKMRKIRKLLMLGITNPCFGFQIYIDTKVEYIQNNVASLGPDYY